MRPQDIVVLLKVLVLGDKPWQYRDLSSMLSISVSEIAESFNRNQLAGLVDESRKKVNRNALMEFVQYGLHYVYPQVPGAIVKGIATAHSHPFYKAHFISEELYVWASQDGNVRGQCIEPLYKGIPQVVQQDEELYKLLASIDILRVGKVREKKLALEELKKAIL